MWSLHYPVYELVLRAVLIYGALFVMFRLVARKQLGEMSPFDFVLLLIVSESVSGGLIGKEYSALGGLISAGSLLVAAYTIDYIAFKSKRFEKIVEGEPQVIVLNGRLRPKILEEEKITLGELHESLREHGVQGLRNVQLAVLETNGKISVVRKK